MQYLEKEVCDGFDILHADRNKILLKTDAMILHAMIKHSQSSQNSKIEMSLQ